MLHRALPTFLLVAAIPTLGQQTSIFRDTSSGISFRYPSTWALAKQQPFMFPLLSSDPGIIPQALVFTRSVSGIPSWPTTDFTGAEFGFDAHQAVTADACLALALPKSKRAVSAKQVTLHGIRFWHSTAGDGGMSQYLAEDVYATFLGHSKGLCLLFDFGVSSSTMSGAAPPRALNSREQSLLHRIERNILSSIRIPAPLDKMN